MWLILINKQLPSNMKEINHFGIWRHCICFLWFWIVQFNLARCFWDTYFIGIMVRKSALDKRWFIMDLFYAATNNGIREPLFQWKFEWLFNQCQIATGVWSHRNFDMELVAINTSGNIHRYNTNTNSFYQFFSYLGQSTFDMRANDTYLIITSAQAPSIFTINKCSSSSNNQIPESNPAFSCATNYRGRNIHWDKGRWSV
jgi:hypothetical protein